MCAVLSLDGKSVNPDEYNFTTLFRIDSRSGDVRVNGDLDITKVQKIRYTVQAVDIAATPNQVGYGMQMNISLL